MKRSSALVLGVIIGFLVGMVVIYGTARLQTPPTISELGEDPAAKTKVQIDAPAPDFKLKTISGDTISLGALKGRVILINFWATWCAPCRVEMPIFQSRSERYGSDLMILAINGQDTSEDTQAFMQELGLTFDALMDDLGEVHNQYLVRGFPTSFLVDADGVLRVQHIGVMTENQLDDYLKKLGLGD